MKSRKSVKNFVTTGKKKNNVNISIKQNGTKRTYSYLICLKTDNQCSLPAMHSKVQSIAPNNRTP